MSNAFFVKNILSLRISTIHYETNNMQKLVFILFFFCAFTAFGQYQSNQDTSSIHIKTHGLFVRQNNKDKKIDVQDSTVTKEDKADSTITKAQIEELFDNLPISTNFSQSKVIFFPYGSARNIEDAKKVAENFGAGYTIFQMKEIKMEIILEFNIFFYGKMHQNQDIKAVFDDAQKYICTQFPKEHLQNAWLMIERNK